MEKRAGAKVIEDWLVEMMTEYADPFGLRKYKSPWISKDVANNWLAEEKVALLLDGLDGNRSFPPPKKQGKFGT